MSEDRKVFVVNKSGHDYSEAKKYGKLVYLTTGHLRADKVNSFYRDIAEKMRDSSPNDFVLITSLPILCSVACSIMSFLHGRINLLLFKDGKYRVRTVKLDELLVSCETAEEFEVTNGS